MLDLLPNVSIKRKVIGSSTILLLLLAAGFGYALTTMKTIGGELEAIVEENIPLSAHLSEITIHNLEQGLAFERALHYGALSNEGKARFNNAVESFEKNNTRLVKQIREAVLLAENGSKFAHTEEELQKYAHVAEAMKGVETAHEGYVRYAEAVFGLFERGEVHSAESAAEKVEHQQEALIRELEVLTKDIQEFTLASGKMAEAHEHTAESVLLGILVFGLLFAMVVSWLTIQAITRGLNRAVRCAETVASGDLTQAVKVESTDEVGRLLTAMETMRTKLVSMFAGINGAASQLACSAEELSAVTAQTTAGIQQQTMETEQVATAMNEMAATVDEVAQSASNAAQGAREADSAAQAGQQVVNETIHMIEQLAGSVDKNSLVVRRLNEDSDKIGVVLDVIRGIAEQTNLLALNAAIEAARAGEQGRGFAVVADEVRTLASRTQVSTQEIQEVIEGLQAGAREAMTAMENEARQAQTGVEAVGKAGEALQVITRSVASINDRNHQIASAAEEQSAVAKEIDKSVVCISQAATETSHGAEQIAQASRELAELSSGLQGMIAEFKV